MEIKIDMATPEMLPEAARKFLEAIGDRRHIAFDAPMGAGKTTFIAEVCRQLGAGDEVASPTFSIINEYEGDKGRICHFDFYRIEDLREAADMGLDDYFDSGDLCFMEWPMQIAPMLPEDLVMARIDVDDAGRRTMTLSTDPIS